MQDDNHGASGGLAVVLLYTHNTPSIIMLPIAPTPQAQNSLQDPRPGSSVSENTPECDANPGGDVDVCGVPPGPERTRLKYLRCEAADTDDPPLNADNISSADVEKNP